MQPKYTTSDISRFWSFVDKSSDCWVWTGAHHPLGYGVFTIGSKTNKTRRGIGSHRVSYELVYGPIPPGKLICHKCDNPRCVNPAHLYVGNKSDNALDMYTRGRGHTPDKWHSGERHHLAKLTQQQVDEIRHRHVRGATGVELAQAYGISRSMVSNIINWRNWKNRAT